ncbi:hypothetical protein RhiirA1_496544 [Rhizophagus irregularis]|uniref:Uncharacterized protein n=2 Tax=Rhizophagus irregularis TaxID=588596 RepID=A0A2N0S7M8_9GLOM|nr:hypothetical protein RhiirA1_496544 [Rhizophagus irregularis]
MFKGMIHFKYNVYNDSFQTIIPNLNHFRLIKIPSTLLLIRLKSTSSRVSESTIVPKKELLKGNRSKLWTEDEFITLRNAVNKHGKDWNYISKNYFFENRTPSAILTKWNRFWSINELQTLKKAVKKHGKDWNYISEKYFNNNRTSNALLTKWKYLKNELNLKNSKIIGNRWTEDELKTLKNAVKKHGKDWNYISEKYFNNNRTSNALLTKWKYLKNELDKTEDVVSNLKDSKIIGNRWTEDELKTLKTAVKKHGKDWNYISEKYFNNNRTSNALLTKWKYLKNELNLKNSKIIGNRWTEDELKTLKNAVKKHGKDWNYISEKYFNNNRTSNALLTKWKYLKNELNLKNSKIIGNRWTEDELKTLKNAVKKHGKDWNYISEKYFNNNRTSNALLTKWKYLKNELNLKNSKIIGNRWTEDELKTLKNAVKKHGKDWNYISEKYFNNNRTSNALLTKWKYLKNELNLKNSKIIGNRWTEDELKTLKNAVKKHGKDWNYISEKYFNNNRTSNALLTKWKYLKNELDKTEDVVSNLKDSKIIGNRWTEDELKTLKNAVEEHGCDWKLIFKKYFHGNRSLRAISNKWKQFKNESWSKEEDKLLFDLIKEHGMHWKKISKLMNRSHDSVSKRYEKVTHEKCEKREKRLTYRDRKKYNLYENYDELQKLIDKYGRDWTKIAKIMNRSKNSVLKQYLFMEIGQKLLK